MPIKSWLAFAQENQFKGMIQKISNIDYIEVVPAKNHDLAVVVLETPDEETDKRCWNQLESIQEISCLAMVFGHADTTQLEV